MRRSVRNEDHADEVVARVYAYLSRSFGDFRGDCPPEAYVMRIAASAIKNYYRRDLPRMERNVSFEGLEYEFPDWRRESELGEGLAVQDTAARLLKFVREACTDVECGVIMLAYRGSTLAEVAELSGIKPETVRSHFLRARENVLAHLRLHAPDLLGGEGAIAEAVLACRKEGTRALTDEEEAAVLAGAGKRSLLKRAMLKIGPFLTTVLDTFIGVVCG